MENSKQNADAVSVKSRKNKLFFFSYSHNILCELITYSQFCKIDFLYLLYYFTKLRIFFILITTYKNMI